MVRDEWNTDDDATYVWTNQDWVSDFYTCDALPEGVTGINGIMLVADVRKAENGSGTRNFTLLVYSESNERRQHVEWQHGHLGQHALEVLLGHLRARPRQIGGVGQRGLGCSADRHFILARWRDGSVSRRAPSLAGVGNAAIVHRGDEAPPAGAGRAAPAKTGHSGHAQSCSTCWRTR